MNITLDDINKVIASIIHRYRENIFEDRFEKHSSLSFAYF